MRASRTGHIRDRARRRRRLRARARCADGHPGDRARRGREATWWVRAWIRIRFWGHGEDSRPRRKMRGRRTLKSDRDGKAWRPQGTEAKPRPKPLRLIAKQMRA